MTITEHIAKSLYVRRGQFGQPRIGEDPNSFHIYEPGPSWQDEHDSWNNLTDNEKDYWMSEATIWKNNLEEKSPITYSYISSNFKNSLVTPDNLDIL